MKKILILIVLSVISSSCCKNKTEEPITKATKTNSKILRTKSGYIFVINEIKTSASLSNISIIPQGFKNTKDTFLLNECVVSSMFTVPITTRLFGI